MRAIDVMGFAGGFDCGVEQAGFEVIAKREPDAFGGFGVSQVETNIEGVQVEVTGPEFWSVVDAELVFGNPPCSGFSMLSTINTAESKTGKMVDGVRVSQRGMDSPDNQWLAEMVSYAADVKPEVMIFESVQSAGKLGAPLMKRLWHQLRDESGVDYHHTQVFMNAALVGGDVIRPRFFWVAHTRPFGVDLPRQRPRTFMEVVGDLDQDVPLRTDEGVDVAWGHVTNGSSSDLRIRQTIDMFRAQGYDWQEGKRLPEHLTRWVEEMGGEYPEWWYGKNGELLSHAISDNMYSPFRWRANQPMGVVTGGVMDRAVHPVAGRALTYREAARFMSLPDDWSLAHIVAGKKDSWLGKGIPVASGRWIASWAKASIEGDPGEYAGQLIEPKFRVIDVTTEARVDAVDRDREAPVWWHDVGVKRLYVVNVSMERPAPVMLARRPAKVHATRRATPRDHGEARVAREARVGRPPGLIERIAPEVVAAEMTRLGLTRKQAADALGVSPSRIAEITTHSRPKSWLNAERWPDVQASLSGYAEV